MVTEDHALDYLYKFANTSSWQPYASGTCVKEFKASFINVTTSFDTEPPKPATTFIKDELVWDGKVFGGNEKNRTST